MSNIQDVLEKSLLRSGVPGASVAVFENGRVTTAAAGVVNFTTGVEVTPETVMHIGSITKVINATLVMQLVDEAKIDLDDRVIQHLPDLKLKDPEALEQITVRMLLNHTSGIDGELLPDQGHDEETIEKAIGRFRDFGQLYRPGNEYSYCNAASVIAGYLVQRVRRRSWYQLVRERIFEPLNLEHSVVLPEEAVLHRASVGHYRNRSEACRLKRTSTAFLPLGFAPCGTTLMMSARDLVTFAKVHMTKGVAEDGTRILSTDSVDAMQQITVNNRGKGYTYGDGTGLGWMVFEDGTLHHSGGGPGIASALYAHPKQDWAVAVLTNMEYGVSLKLITELVDPWLKRAGDVKAFGVVDICLPSAPVELDPERYVGVYGDVLNQYSVSRTRNGIALSKQMTFAPYENMSAGATAAEPLTPITDKSFLLGPNSSGPDVLYRVFTFRNPDSHGRMQHLGNGLRLYKRVS